MLQWMLCPQQLDQISSDLRLVNVDSKISFRLADKQNLAGTWPYFKAFSENDKIVLRK